jgi:bifunctional DNA-binding transcriptional regulator/antitoxin component of YhaV-PrlF toxin-antitoxin module
MPAKRVMNNNIIVYPNPTKDKININKNVDVIVFNYLGDMIISKQDVNVLDVSKISSGMYMLQITYENKTINKRIIKK